MKAQSSTNEATQGDQRGVAVGKYPLFEDLLWEWVAIQERSIHIWKGEEALA
jgi:hypothetical protein